MNTTTMPRQRQGCGECDHRHDECTPAGTCKIPERLQLPMPLAAQIGVKRVAAICRHEGRCEHRRTNYVCGLPPTDACSGQLRVDRGIDILAIMSLGLPGSTIVGFCVETCVDGDGEHIRNRHGKQQRLAIDYKVGDAIVDRYHQRFEREAEADKISIEECSEVEVDLDCRALLGATGTVIRLEAIDCGVLPIELLDQSDLEGIEEIHGAPVRLPDAFREVSK